METTQTKSGRVIRRIVAILIVLGIPLGIVISKVWSEPYPWLFAPRFGNVGLSGPTFASPDSAVWAITDTGERISVPHEVLLPDVVDDPILQFEIHFSKPSTRPGYADWLVQRLSVAGIDNVVALEFKNCVVERTRDGGKIVTQNCANSFTVDLPGAPQ
ncbi:MAG: hypothetical protein ACOYBP_03345 [Microbacteriaceae bacterium]